MRARVAAYYKFNPYQLAPDELRDLDAMIPAMRAADLLRDHGATMKPDDVRKLTLLATDDENQALAAWRRAIDREIARHRPKE